MNPQRILIRAPNPVGDVVMSTPVLRALRRGFPQARITVLVRRGRDKILEGLSDFDELLIDETKDGLRKIVQLARALRPHRYDLALFFANSLRTAIAAWLAGIPERVGYRKNGQGLFLTLPLRAEREGRRWKPKPMPRIYAEIAKAVGVEVGDFLPRLEVGPKTEEEARQRRKELGLSEGEPLIGLAPGASFGASKLWPPERFAAAADALAERWGARVILFAGPGEEGIVRQVAGAMRSKPVLAADPPLGLDLLKPFIRDLKLLLTTDSGPRHYAAAFGVPAVVVMGPTDPRWSDVERERTVVLRRDVPCGPCHLRVCPLDHRCMLEIDVEAVVDAALELDRKLGVFT